MLEHRHFICRIRMSAQDDAPFGRVLCLAHHIEILSCPFRIEPVGKRPEQDVFHNDDRRCAYRKNQGYDKRPAFSGIYAAKEKRAGDQADKRIKRDRPDKGMRMHLKLLVTYLINTVLHLFGHLRLRGFYRLGSRSAAFVIFTD